MKTLQILLSALILTLLAACGGGGGGSGGTTAQGSISGTATKGPVNGATVTAYAISNGQMGALIGTSQPTGSNGSFTVNTGNYAGPVMLQMSGGTYPDEATGNPNMPMGPGDVMTAVIPAVTAGATISGIQVTPLTAMAQTMAQHMTGGMTDANITAANTAMGTYFAVNDILHTMPMNPLVAGSGTGASQDAQNYGMALAAMSQYAQTQGMTSSSAMVTAMMNDASDGVMDGKMSGGSQVQMGGMGGMMLPTAGTSGLGGAMNTFMNSANNKSGVTTATLMNKLNGATGQMMGSAPAMVNATVSGTAFNGPMSQATVRAFSINNGAMGAQIASVATDGQGNFTLPLGSYTGPVMLQVSAGTYTDEATTMAMTMGASDVMSAVLPTVASGANVTGIWVTPITSMAQTRAQGMSGGMTDTNIAAANTAMGNYFSVTDILHTQPMNPLVTGSGTGASQDARDYGVTVAAMSQSAKTLNMAVSSALVTAMMNDASDGIMNGRMGASQISMSMGGMMGQGTMASTAGTSSLATGMTAFMNSPANASGLTAADMAALIQKLTSSNGQT